MLRGFFALIAPCGGSFGLPKLISLFTGAAFAVVIVAAVIAPPTAVAANMSPSKTSIVHLCARTKRMVEIVAGFSCAVI
jgi:hypothetical protein